MMAIFTLMNRKNRVVRSWDSVQPVIRFTRSFDGFVKEEELPITHITVESGETYDIPYDPKTGTVSGISSLSGYLTAANGHLLSFCIINQGVPRASMGRSFQDQVCCLLCSVTPDNP